jgi:Undecaprenyl-phosphate glucose phosphotransferase
MMLCQFETRRNIWAGEFDGCSAIGALLGLARSVLLLWHRDFKSGSGEHTMSIPSRNFAPSASFETMFGANGTSAIPKTGAARRASPLMIASIAGATDLLALSLTGLLTAVLWVDASDIFANNAYAWAILATATAAVLAAERMALYSIATLKNPLARVWKITAAWSLAQAILVGALFLLKIGPDFSRGWLVLWFVAGLTVSLIWRGAARGIVQSLARAGRLDRRAVVFGAGEAGASLIARLEADASDEVCIVGIFDDRGIDRIPDSLSGYPLLGNIDQLVSFCRTSDVDLLILSLPVTAERRLLEVLAKLWVLPVDIRLAAHASALRFGPRAYSHVGNVPLLDMLDRPLGEWDRLVKATFDRTVAAIALVGLSPVLALVALAVRLDTKGPILFRQKRLGFNNELIDVWKFRSMYVEQSDSLASRLVTRDDPRVTRVGRFIRKTSLDELPQLFNVLAGSLSLVGPRPHALHAKAANRLYHDVADGYFARHKVKPGITGLAQIRGWRGETDTEEKLKGRIASDLEYIENWSLMLDISILARTPLALLKSENAY